jgi:hypothetical protein
VESVQGSIMEYYSVIKKNEILLFEAKCMKLRILYEVKLTSHRNMSTTCSPSYMEDKNN